MRNTYPQIIKRRFLYTYIVTILSIAIVANYNYLTIVKDNIEDFKAEAFEHEHYLDVQKYVKVSRFEETTDFSILKNSLLMLPIPLFFQVDNHVYMLDYENSYGYYTFILKPTMVLTLILLFLYFSVNRVIVRGMRQLSYFEKFLQKYILADTLDDTLYKKLMQYDDEIAAMSRNVYGLFSKNIKLMQQQRRFLKMIEELHEILLSFDENYKIIDSNRLWKEIEKEEFLFIDYLNQKNLEILKGNIFSLKNGLVDQIKLTDKLMMKETVYEIKIIYVEEVFGVIIHDITQAYEIHQKIKHMSLHDGLTGLANRELFMDRLKSEIQKAKRNNTTLAVMFFDLDDFKEINDLHGHNAGDDVLKTFATRVSESLRETDTFSRFGGDEFLAILPDVENRYIGKVVDKIMESLSLPLEAEAVSCHIKTSIGVSLYPSDGDDAEALINKADKAMYLCKKKDLKYTLFQEM